VVEETHEASSSIEIFPRDYIPPRKPPIPEGVKYVKYPLVESPIPEGVIVEGDMLGLIPTLKYVEHEIIEENKFPKLVPNKLLIKSISSRTHMIVIEPQVWARGLQKTCLLNLFDITHFGWSQEINVCVKMLLSCVHEGYMWLNRTMSINTYLIVHIKGLSL
jgi:hypothetical protein